MNEAPSTGELAGLPLVDVLERLAARTPAPGGGTGAALAAGLAAALVQMASAFADPPAEDRIARAAQLRTRALGLAEEDLESYPRVLRALQRPADDPQRSQQLADALSAASDAPLGIAEVGAETAVLAEAAGESGGLHLRGDCAAAALLAEAACRAGALLVELNLRDTADPRVAEAGRLVQTAGVASQRARDRARER